MCTSSTQKPLSVNRSQPCCSCQVPCSLGLGPLVGLVDGRVLLAAVVARLGENVGLPDGLVGAIVGPIVGAVEGDGVGAPVGIYVGALVGASVGDDPAGATYGAQGASRHAVLPPPSHEHALTHDSMRVFV